MITITVWDVVAFFGYEALLYAGGPLVAIAICLLAVPSLRHNTVSRRIAYGLMVLVGLLVLCAVPMLQEGWKEHEEKVAFNAATHHLTAPQVFGGIAFPAGSTVHVGDDGRVQFGNLPIPTTVDDLPLTGDFRLEAEYGDDPPGVAEGTLAGPADIHGIPCGPGALVSQPDTTRCVLARDYTFAGHILAKGQLLEVYRSPLNDPPKLTFGTLARPELLFDVLWPAGTIIGGIDTPPDRMAHGIGADYQVITFCVPSDLTVEIPGATLHGFLAYDVQRDRRMVSPVCNILPGERVGDDGYAQVGTTRYTWGDRPTADAPWQWTQPMEPVSR
jgi:hypothetical protein